ncbi:MAG: group III truncated hemoglobin [Geminicoccaceae bacterium]
MTDDVRRSVADRRAAILAEAKAIGIDEAYIAKLVEAFYAKVRADALIGPVFERAIDTDRWPRHLATMNSFWASVAFNAGSYSGQPVLVHKRLHGLGHRHFERWLKLFGETLIETAPTDHAVVYLMTRAERIAESLKAAIDYVPHPRLLSA